MNTSLALAIGMFYHFTKKNECNNWMIKRKQINAITENINILESKRSNVMCFQIKVTHVFHSAHHIIYKVIDDIIVFAHFNASWISQSSKLII